MATTELDECPQVAEIGPFDQVVTSWYSRRFVTENGGDRREENYLGPEPPELRE